jgi:hypothetical protein
MKKPMLLGGLALLSGITFAADPTTNPPIAEPTAMPPSEQKVLVPTTPVTTPVTAPATTPAAPITQPINCHYKIPANATVDNDTVLKWSSKAIEQSFDFIHNEMDTQLEDLKSCFTEQGWHGFWDALQKSNNIHAIKSGKLTVSSMIDGQPTLVESKENQWKVSANLDVVYQNEEHKIKQPLSVTVVIGRKMTGDLGIMQMIATPRSATLTKPTEVTAPSTTIEKKP